VLTAFRRPSDALGFDLAAAALCLVAASIAWRPVHRLEWPCENDLFRDMGAAQSILDGALGADPIYLGERWWYNPLVPAIVALTSRATFTELPEAYATLGVYLNLVAPAGFYAVAVTLLGRREALAGLVGFLFLGPLDQPSWLGATYSPWLWTQNFAQGVFYFALVVWLKALARPTLRLGVAAGFGLGLSALAHSAPGLILACVVGVTALAELVTRRKHPAVARRILGLLGVTTLVSAIVAAPFWWSVVVHYQIQIRNPAPLEWLANELKFEVWREELLRLPSFRGSVALVGFAGLFVPRTVASHARNAILAWGAVAVVGIAHGWTVELWRVRPFLPSWHFLFYLRALESLLFGLGVLVLLRTAVWAASKARRFAPSTAKTAERAVPVVVVLGLCALCLTRFGAYKSRFDLVFNRGESIRFAKLPTIALYDWILEKTEPNDVFLADGDAGFRAVMPAGRKLVEIPHIFSNPYVNLEQRMTDAASMRRSLDAGRWDEFVRVARRYDARYATVAASERTAFRRPKGKLRRVYTAARTSGFDVYDIAAESRHERANASRSAGD
jgi:hypothetical protein